MVVFAAFTVLVVLTVARRSQREALLSKRRQDWILDIVGLWIQGLIVPALQLTVIYWLYSVLLPAGNGSLVLPSVAAFLLSFIGADYLYYWNHRILHSRWLWPLHYVHHTVTDLDVLGTSRNSLWSSFFILYLWLHPLFIYLLHDPVPYVFGVSLTAALDLWRHSQLDPKPGSYGHRWLSSWLVMPTDHAQHHSSEVARCNFGANFKLWDRWHGTTAEAARPPASLGIPTPLTLMQQLFWPW
ncbi:MAG: sterol desaturase family protein [Cyanobacteria bacterium P01_E01_bin.34]